MSASHLTMSEALTITRRDAASLGETREADRRWPVPVAVPVIALLSGGLWFAMWRVAAAAASIVS